MDFFAGALFALSDTKFAWLARWSGVQNAGLYLISHQWLVASLWALAAILTLGDWWRRRRRRGRRGQAAGKGAAALAAVVRTWRKLSQARPVLTPVPS